MQMVCARSPRYEGAVKVLALVFVFLLLLASVWLLAVGEPWEKAVGAAGLVLGLFSLACVFELFLNPPPREYCLDKGVIRYGKTSAPLDKFAKAQVAYRPACPLFPKLVHLSLVLKNDLELALPLTYPGWEEVYEAVREERPELELPPWWEEPRIRAVLQAGRTDLIAPPKGARVVRRRVFLALFLALIALLSVALLVALLDLPTALASFFGVLLAFFVYDRVSERRVVHELVSS